MLRIFASVALIGGMTLLVSAQPAPNETALLVSIVRRLLYVMNESGDGDESDTSSHESAP